MTKAIRADSTARYYSKQFTPIVSAIMFQSLSDKAVKMKESFKKMDRKTPPQPSAPARAASAFFLASLCLPRERKTTVNSVLLWCAANRSLMRQSKRRGWAGGKIDENRFIKNSSLD
jgi:hypothetical protein